ncbi:MAG: hypothetical protein Q4G27_06255 [Flavobacteriaceae bacterium]|nr:hypothetical protein [Flavobacteriaceae bacterium]
MKNLKTSYGIYSKLFLGIVSFIHLLSAWIAFLFVIRFRGDANKYWFITQSPEKFLQKAPLPLREYLLYYINYLPAVILDLPLWVGFVLYSAVGMAGIYLLYRAFPLSFFTTPALLLVYAAVLLLPSMHFWTAMIGKEPVMFLGIALVILSMKNFKRFRSLFITGFIITGLIRPHVAAILLLAAFGGYLLTAKKLNLWLIPLMALILAAFGFILLQSHWIPGLSWTGFQRVLEIHHTQLSQSNTYVPLETYSWPYKLYSFYFRPFPGEISNLWGWAMALENIFTQFVVLGGFSALLLLLFRYNYKPNLQEWTILLFFFFLAIVLSMAYSNFGLISRMKVQSLPFMLLLSAYWMQTYLNLKKNDKT